MVFLSLPLCLLSGEKTMSIFSEAKILARGEVGEDRETKGRRRILGANRPDYPIIIRGGC